jgi:hypothetical protein
VPLPSAEPPRPEPLGSPLASFAGVEADTTQAGEGHEVGPEISLKAIERLPARRLTRRR